MTERQDAIRQLFSASALDPLPRIVGESVAGRRVTIAGHNGRTIRFDVVELDFVPATSRPAKRIERQLDRAIRTAEASLLNPFEAMRKGVQFMAGAVEETIGAIQEAPYDPAGQKLDLFDDVALTLESVTVESVTGPTWTIDSIDIQVKLLQVGAAPADASFRIVATGMAFEAGLTPDDVVGLVDPRLRNGLSARVSPEGDLFIDVTRARGRVSLLCEIEAVAGSIVVNVRQAVLFGKKMPLPKRFHRSGILRLEPIVPDLLVSEVVWNMGQFVISGDAPNWQRLLTPDQIRSITSQLASGST